MKAEEFINTWLNSKYGGGKGMGFWTHGEVKQLLKDFQQQIWEESQQVAFESEETEETLSVEYLELDELKKILEVEEL